jgi:chromosome partitioning protein
VAKAAKKPAKRLRVICLASSKGGNGKSTLSANLAVRASQDSERVCLIDADPQSSLAKWWELRGEPATPKLLDCDATAENIELVLAEGWDFCFIDTPPGMVDTIEDAIIASDFVVIPVRASALDLLAVDHVVELCKKHKRPFSFVLNAVMPGWRELADSAAQYLRRIGPVFDARIGMRKAYVSSMTIGKTGPELERTTAAKEIDELWAAITLAMSKGTRK